MVRPFGMRRWVYWVLVLFVAGLLGQIPYVGPVFGVFVLLLGLVGYIYARQKAIPGEVSVQFRELTQEPWEGGSSYSYLWQLNTPPVVGMRVWVQGVEGRSPAVIVGLGKTDYPATVPVSAIVTDAEIEAAHLKADADEVAWLEMARKRAGLPSSSRKRKVPDGYPEIAPVEGEATRGYADEFGRMWWRAYKTAERRGLPDDEVQHLASIAHRWFAIRDRG